CEQRPGPQIHRRPQVRPHPLLRGGTRIRGRADVNEMQGPLTQLPGMLPRHLPVRAKAEVERIRLDDATTQRRLEQARVQVADYLQILTDVVNRRVRTELLGVPDAQ